MRFSLTFVACLLYWTTSHPVTAQDGNPFSPERAAAKAVPDDPFAATAKHQDPFAANRKDRASAQRKTLTPQEQNKNRLLQLEAEVKELKYALAERSAVVDHLKKAVMARDDKNELLAAMLIEKNEMHQRIFGELLDSENPKDQLRGLQHYLDCRNYWTEKERPAKWLTISLGETDAHNRLLELVESDDSKVQRKAVNVLGDFSPSAAAEKGFQFGPTWRPTGRLDQGTEKIYRAFSEPTSFDFEAMPFDEILEELSQHYGINIQPAPDVDVKKSITFASTGAPLDETLHLLLDNHDLAYRVTKGSLLILKKDDERTIRAHTYNVRGLLTDKLDINGVVKLIEDRFKGQKKPVKTNEIDNHRLVIIGTENDHREVGALLASIAN